MAWSNQARQAAIAARKARTTGHDAGIKNRKAAAQSELGRALVRKSTRVGPIGNIKALSTGPSSPLTPPSTPASPKAKLNAANAIQEIQRFNQHGPIGGKEPFLKDSPSPLSRPQTGMTKPPKKAKATGQTSHDKWKASWGMGGG